MNRIISTFVLMACITYTPLAVSASPCPPYATRYLKQWDPTTPLDGYSCGNELSNLQVTLPAPMKVVAAGGLWWADGREIDLKRQKVSLDHYTNGDIPHGQIFIGGRIRLSGVLAYEPGNSGDAWFFPQPALISPQYKALAAELRSLKFIGDRSLAKFGFSQSLLSSNCFRANANIEIDGISLLIGETDEAGAYPIFFNVLNVSGVKKCSTKE